MFFIKPDEWAQASLAAWDRQTGQLLEQLYRDPLYLQSSWQLMASMFDTLTLFKQSNKRLLQLWQLPTRDAHDHLLHRLNRLEIELDDIEFAVDELLHRS